MNTSCTPDINFFDSPQFLAISMHIVTVTVTPFHFLGLYCILYKTPAQMKAVKWYLLNLHVSVMFFDYSVTLLGVPFILATRLAGFSLGLLKFSSYSFLVTMAVSVVALQSVFIAISGIFESRFRVICKFRWVAKWKKLVSPFFLPYQYIVYPSHLACCVFLIPDQESALKELFKTLPCLPREIYEAPIYVIIEDMRYPMLMIVLNVAAVTIQIIFFVSCLVVSSLAQLKQKTMSQKTFQMQKQFLVAVIVQSTAPIICFMVPLFYFIIAFFLAYYNQGIINCLLVIASIHGLISTISMMVLHRPYREALWSSIVKTPEVKRLKVLQLSTISRSKIVVL